MSQDYAKKKRNRGAVKNGNKGARARKHPEPRNWTWFFSGMASGVFLCFLGWLAAQQPDPEAVPIAQTPTPSENPSPSPKLEFEFYGLLKEQEVTVDVDPADVARARRAEDMDRFLLQAGSFRQEEDAERRRARLILLGLDPKIQDTTGENGRWFRVFIGPFESKSKLQKARSLTAQDGIETLLLKRPAS